MSLRALLLKTLLISSLAVLPIGCSKPPAEFNETVFTFGTLVEITMFGVDEKTANLAYSAVLDDLSYMHNTWHAWHPSALSRVNGLLRTGSNFGWAPSILPLITQAQQLSEKSQGLFNPAIGELIELWGFHSDERDNSPPPADDAIQSLVAAAPSMKNIVIDGLSMHSTNKHVRLDFGGFAKGLAVDNVIERLRLFGIKNAVVNAGGDLRAIGNKNSRPWHIGIRNPDGEGVIASIDISGDESVFTSGDYERFFESGGSRYHHIIDPRTGYPAMGTRSVTVVYSNGAVADAAATALFVAGPDKWPTIAKNMGVDQVMLIASDGRVQMTAGMAKRIHFENGYSPAVSIMKLPATSP
jgi:thiamine biosynthesis lipoprotein